MKPLAILCSPPRRIALAAFFFSASVCAALVVLPFFVFNQLGGGALMVGLFAGVQAVCYAITSLVSARYVARARHGLVFAVVGMLGFLGCICVMPMSRQPMICGAMFCAAFTMSAFAWPALHSWVGAEPLPALRARHMGMVNVGWSTGGIAGPLLAGPLYVLGYPLPFILIGILGLLATCLVLSMPHENDYFGTACATVIQARAAHDLASETFLYCAWTATFVSHVFIGATRAVFPKRLDDLVSAGALRILHEAEPLAALNTAAATRFSWLAMAMGAGTAGAFLLLGRTAWWHHRFSILAAAQMGAGCAVWLLGHTQSLLIMAGCFALVGANLGLAFFSSGYYGMANPLRKHGRAAINEGVVGLGGFAGSMGFAWAAEHYGIGPSLHLAPLVIVVLIPAQLLLLRKRGLPPDLPAETSIPRP